MPRFPEATTPSTLLVAPATFTTALNRPNKGNMHFLPVFGPSQNTSIRQVHMEHVLATFTALVTSIIVLPII
jgi:hypothetical protein